MIVRDIYQTTPDSLHIAVRNKKNDVFYFGPAYKCPVELLELRVSSIHPIFNGNALNIVINE